MHLPRSARSILATTSMWRSLALLLLGALSLHAATASAEALPSSASSETENDANAIQLRCDDVLGRLGFRGVAALGPIRCGIMDEASLRARMLEELDTENSPAQIEAEAALLRQLGLMGSGVRYRDFLVDLLSEQVIGFYDPREKALHLVDGVDDGMLEPVLSHEIFHALQDQHYDLELFQAGREQNADLGAARQALLEGDALAVLFDYAMPFGLSFTAIPNLESMLRDVLAEQPEMGEVMGLAPQVIQSSLLFSYIEGLFFVRALKLAGGWPAVDAVYRQPPMSTEQILHPERYVEPDAPVALDFEVPAALGEAVYDQVFGELGYRLYFAQHADELALSLDALAAADGWDGDRLRLYATDQGNTLVALSLWDSAAEAADFAAALELTLRARHPGLVCERRDDLLRCALASLSYRIERRADTVLQLEGVRDPCDEACNANPGSAERELAATVWATAQRSAYESYDSARERAAANAKVE